MKSVLKSVALAAFFLSLALLWAPLGHAGNTAAKDQGCRHGGAVEEWLESHATLKDWAQFYFDQHQCHSTVDEFLKALAASEPLSTKLNQERVTFEQFYVPLAHLMKVNWNGVRGEEMPDVQSNLMLIDVSLKKVLVKMNDADADYFKSMVLSESGSDFVRRDKSNIDETYLARRINFQPAASRHPMHYRDVVPTPYEPAHMPR